MLNILTIDVEDWFHILDIRDCCSLKNWDNLEIRVARNTEKLLEILKENKIKATFFILGWVAERYPELVKIIAQEGHEIASHSYAHKLVYEMSKEEFRKDLKRSKETIESIIGNKIYGYRASGFSIINDTKWAFEILTEESFLYDASVFPAVREHGGMPDAPIHPYMIKTSSGPLWEFPISVLNFAGKNMAFCGGGYLRLFPYWFIKYGIKKINKKGYPVVVFLHPREIDANQPRMKLPLKRKFKYYVKLSSTEDKLKKILKDFSFGTIKEVLDIK